MGDPFVASAEKGERIFNLAVERLILACNELHNYPVRGYFDRGSDATLGPAFAGCHAAAVSSARQIKYPKGVATMITYSKWEVARKISLSPERVTGIARDWGIGEKVNGQWRFTDEDVDIMRDRRSLGPYQWNLSDKPDWNGTFSFQQIVKQNDHSVVQVYRLATEGKAGHKVDDIWRFTPEDIENMKNCAQNGDGTEPKRPPLDFYQELGVKRVINAAGTLTRLGGTPMDDDVLDAMREAAQVERAYRGTAGSGGELPCRSNGCGSGVRYRRRGGRLAGRHSRLPGWS